MTRSALFCISKDMISEFYSQISSRTPSCSALCLQRSSIDWDMSTPVTCSPLFRRTNRNPACADTQTKRITKIVGGRATPSSTPRFCRIRSYLCVGSCISVTSAGLLHFSVLIMHTIPAWITRPSPPTWPAGEPARARCGRRSSG